MPTAAATSTERSRRRARTRGSRLTGFGVAIAVNAAFLYAANVWPGWEAVPFLTTKTTAVLPLFNASLAVAAAVNLVNLIADRRWVQAVGELITAVIGIVVLIQLLAVFPFTFDDSVVEWALILRVVFGVGIAGCAISILVQLVVLVRAALDPTER